MKKILLTLTVITLIATNASLTLAKEGYFSDVDSSHTNYAAIQDLKEKNIINGYADGTFRPDDKINRAELLTMVANMKGGVSVTDAQKADYENCFKDVKAEWYAHAVCKAKMEKWVDGYPDGTFLPAGNANRAEAVKIVVNTSYGDMGEQPAITEAEKALVSLPTNLEANIWYYDLMNFAFRKNILDPIAMDFAAEGTFTYQISGSITRKEVAEMIYRLQLVQNNFIINQKSYLTGDWVYKEKKMINGQEVEDYVSLNILVNNGNITGGFTAGATTEENGALYINSGTFNGKYEMGDKDSISGSWEGERDDHGQFILQYDPVSYSILWQTDIVEWDDLYTLPQFMRLEKPPVVTDPY